AEFKTAFADAIRAGGSKIAAPADYQFKRKVEDTQVFGFGYPAAPGSELMSGVSGELKCGADDKFESLQLLILAGGPDKMPEALALFTPVANAATCAFAAKDKCSATFDSYLQAARTALQSNENGGRHDAQLTPAKKVLLMLNKAAVRYTIYAP